MSGIEGTSKEIAKAIHAEWKEYPHKNEFKVRTVRTQNLPKHLQICYKISIAPKTLTRWLENASVFKMSGIEGSAKEIANLIETCRIEEHRKRLRTSFIIHG